MSADLWHKFFDPASAFSAPITVWMLSGVAAMLLVAPIIVRLLDGAGRLSPPMRLELMTRWRSWIVLVIVMVVPVLLGPGCLMVGVTILSLLCYREFARGTGFFRERLLSTVVVLGIVAIGVACLDHYYGFFVALPSLILGVIAIAGMIGDRPEGYLQRVSIGALCFLLFGVSLGHLGYMANATDYRPLIIAIVLCAELNDVFAFISGKTFGHKKLAPNTSPGKTLGGVIGALVLTTALFAVLGHFVFRGGPLDTPVHLITMGALLSILGQFGDLLVSSVKRDLGVKDFGALIPGHGGVLDRFDSLLLVPPVLFHYIHYVAGIGVDETARIISG